MMLCGKGDWLLVIGMGIIPIPSAHHEDYKVEGTLNQNELPEGIDMVLEPTQKLYLKEKNKDAQS